MTEIILYYIAIVCNMNTYSKESLPHSIPLSHSGVPFCCVCRVCSTAWDGARWLCALVRCLQKLHHEELQKSGCQRSATGKANDVPFTAKPNAGSQETIEVKCLRASMSSSALKQLELEKNWKRKFYNDSNNKKQVQQVDHLECWQRLHLPSCLSGNWSVTNVFLTFASSQ